MHGCVIFSCILLPVCLARVVILHFTYRPGKSIRGKGINLHALTEANNSTSCSRSSS